MFNHKSTEVLKALDNFNAVGISKQELHLTNSENVLRTTPDALVDSATAQRLASSRVPG